MDLDFSKAEIRLGLETHSVVIAVEGRLFFALLAPPGPSGKWVRFEISADAFKVLDAEPYRHAALHRVLELVIAERLREGKEPGSWEVFAGIASTMLAESREMVAQVVEAMSARHKLDIAEQIDLDVAYMAAKRVPKQGFYDSVDFIEGGRLNYNIGVESGFTGTTFDFDITAADAHVLACDLRRRLTLHWILHTILQSTMTRTREPVEQAEFRTIADTVLHGAQEAVEALIDQVDKRHNIGLRIYIERDIQRVGSGRAT